MTMIKPFDIGVTPALPPSFEMILAVIVVNVLEISFSLLIYRRWLYRTLRSRAVTLDTEIWRFIGSFMVAFAIINVLWFFTMIGYMIYRGLIMATILAAGAFLMETLISMAIYRLIYGNPRAESTAIATGIKRFIIIFIAVFTIVNAVWIDMWAIGWFS